MRAVLMTDADSLTLVGDIPLNGTPGWYIRPKGLDGLWGGVAPRVDDLTRPDADGEYWPSQILLGARYQTVLGAHVDSSSSVAEAVARDRIARLLGRRIDLMIESPAGARWTAGFISQQPEFEHFDAFTCTFGFILKCPDPLWYGVPVTYSGTSSAHVENNGNRPSWPTSITLHDVTGGASITSLDHEIAYSGPACDELVLSPRNGAAMADGEDVRSLMENDYFPIPPGGADITVSGAGSVAVEARSAWL